MSQNFALPKFQSPEASRQKLIKWIAVSTAGLAAMLTVVVVSVVMSRNAEARARAAQIMQERAAVDAARVAEEREASRKAALADRVARELESGKGLPPRAEPIKTAEAESDKASSGSRSSRKSRKGRGGKGVVTASKAVASPDGQKRMKSDEIDKLLSQF